MDQFNAIKTWLRARKDKLNHRQLVWVSGDRLWTNEVAEQIIENSASVDYIWVGERLNGKSTLKHSSIRSILGSEYQNVVYNACDEFSLNALFTISGVIKANGLLVLLSPDRKLWSQSCRTLASQSHGYSKSKSFFIEFLSDCFDSDPCVLKIKQNNLLPINANQAQSFCININNDDIEDNANKLAGLTLEQSRVATSVIQSIEKHTHYAATIIAKRGRGKSWLMGWLARYLIECDKKIALVAPQSKSINQIFKHLEGNKKDSLPKNANASLTYCAPDSPALLDVKYDVIIVDEAAAIPIPALKRLLFSQPRCLFSTTIDGYEGSASGFKQRFLQLLECEYKYHYESLELINPMRWHKGDYLEQTMSSILSTPTSTTEPKRISPMETESVKFELIAKESLLQRPNMALEIFSILTDAHYQTTPNDFVRLLDAKDSVISILRSSEKVVAAALCIVEGGDKLNSLDTAIATGVRRVKGHMTPQYLSYNTTQKDFSRLTYLRINRIAVNPFNQGQGLGSKLVGLIVEYARNLDFDMVSTIFGDTQLLRAFWHKNHFTRFKVGEKVDKASGELSALYLQALTQQATNLIADNITLTDTQQTQKLIDFIHGSRNIASIRAALHALFNDYGFFKLSNEKTSLLSAIVQSTTISEPALIAQFNLSGKNQLKKTLQQELSDYFAKQTGN